MVLILHLLSLFFPYSDNPNYFNTSSKSEFGSGSKTPENGGGSSKGFFLFRRKSTTSKQQSTKNSGNSDKNEVKGVNGASTSTNKSTSKHKGSFRSLLRSKSGSSHTMVSVYFCLFYPFSMWHPTILFRVVETLVDPPRMKLTTPLPPSPLVAPLAVTDHVSTLTTKIPVILPTMMMFLCHHHNVTLTNLVQPFDRIPPISFIQLHSRPIVGVTRSDHLLPKKKVERDLCRIKCPPCQHQNRQLTTHRQWVLVWRIILRWVSSAQEFCYSFDHGLNSQFWELYVS